jgi:HEAT repeat-containing protein 5
MGGNASGSSGANASIDSSSTQRQQAMQQQQNAAAQLLMNEKIKNTLSLLSNGFNKASASSSGGFNIMRGVVGTSTSRNSLDDSAVLSLSRTGSSSSSLSNGGVSLTTSNSIISSNNLIDSSTSLRSIGFSGSSNATCVINREVRVGVTYAYVELANLLGTQWLEKNLTLYITHILNLVNSTRAVSTHVDAVYSRKCVQFILRSIIGGMLNEKMQLQAARELINIIDKCINLGEQTTTTVNSSNTSPSGTNSSSEQTSSTLGSKHLSNLKHVLICALHELSCIFRSLNTSASILVNDEASLRMIEKIMNTLTHPSEAVKCVGAWCMRTLAASLPALTTTLLESCMDRLTLVRSSADPLLGYGYACAALMGAVHMCPLGIPHLKAKLAFNIGEELLRTASQNSQIALQKVTIGWLLLSSFMTMGVNLVRKHLSRLIKLWKNTMPMSQKELEADKKRGDAFTWKLSLEERSGALSCIHSFLVNCSELIAPGADAYSVSEHTNTTTSPVVQSEELMRRLLVPIEGAIMLLSQLRSIIKANNNAPELIAKAAKYRLRLYQTLIAIPSPHVYESSYATVLRELVDEFTLAEQLTGSGASYVTSMLRSVCHSNDSILFSANYCLQDADYKAIEEQLQAYSVAGGCEALEHDVAYLYQKSHAAAMSNSLLSASSSLQLYNANNSKPSQTLFNSSAPSLAVSVSVGSGNSTCAAALPLGVAVIDASIQLYCIMYPKLPNKYRLQILSHFIECIQRHPTSKSNASTKQTLQINIFTAVLGSLKSLAENKSDIGDDAVKKRTLELVMEALCDTNPLLRCAAGEALGRMTQVVAEPHFVIEVAQFCFEK